ncbi:hypothetical protein R3P38DRAFT_3226638 [Favolaschia claudopus]|uniref:F-box domain-containing protein n=1 Tax=Favolaschia claudopus TaxID=2862362 RepID=A0AAV9ZUL3_9AGAR
MGLAVSRSRENHETAAAVNEPGESAREEDGAEPIEAPPIDSDYGYLDPSLQPRPTATMKSGIDGAVSSTQVEWTPVVPTNAEVLADLRARLVELNLGISHLKGPLRRPNPLFEERYSIRRTLDSFANHPVFRIPPEILQEIFFCCLPDDTDGPFVPSPKTAPLLLLNVCRAWREIALAAPHLWRTIRLNLPSKNYENTLTLFNLWLERARSVPYSVAVVYTDYEDKPSPDVIIEALTQTSEQWQDVRLELPFKDLQRLNALEGKVPLLRKLLIGPTDAYFTGLQGMRIPPITAFSVAPLLREVRLVTGFPFTLELPWAQLTKLQATSLSVCECLDILEASPSLVECTLSLRKSFDLMDASPIPAARTPRGVHPSYLGVPRGPPALSDAPRSQRPSVLCRALGSLKRAKHCQGDRVPGKVRGRKWTLEGDSDFGSLRIWLLVR